MDALAISPDAGLRLGDWIDRHRRIFVLTGAGCSTASGIPDYRDANGVWKQRAPVTFQDFTGTRAAYRRYWARSYAGWPRISAAAPNAAHRALAALEATGPVSVLVTQNVDGLHQRAGSRNVVDLHGRLDEVVCLGCRLRRPRAEWQTLLADSNRDWHAGLSTTAPDGDAVIDDRAVAAFLAPDCETCGGLVKPDVVFFGENVPRSRFERAREALRVSDALLVVGSSLMVYSGFRFVRTAHEAGLPVAILNSGITRADALATLKLEADAGSTLQEALR